MISSELPWEEVFEDEDFVYAFMHENMSGYLQNARWFGAKDSHVKDYRVEWLLPVQGDDHMAYLLIVEVVFATAFTQNYLVPLLFIPDGTAQNGFIAAVSINGQPGAIVDGIYVESFRNNIFKHIVNQRTFNVPGGKLFFEKGSKLPRKILDKPLESKLLNAEQSNTTVVFNDRYYLKIYRKLFRDANPDYELSNFLSERTDFKNSPGFSGGISWKRAGLYEVTLGLMQEKIDNEGEAWQFVLNNVEEYFKRFIKSGMTLDDLPKVDLYKPISFKRLPEIYQNLIGKDVLRMYQRLARRTAEMHVALYSDRNDRLFSPEVFRSDYRVWLLNRLLYMLDNRMNSLEQNLDKLPPRAFELALEFLQSKDRVVNRILNFDDQKLNSGRIRIHGDYHLGQILISNKDFFILDFEGEPESTIRDRKVKQPPLKDLAGLFRSFHYAIFATVFNQGKQLGKEEAFLTEAGGRYYRAVVAISLYYYCQTAFDQGLNIGYAKEIDFLLRYHIFEKAIYELGYELHSRPDWVIIPLKGIMQILNNE